MNRPVSSLVFYFFPPLQATKEAARWFLKVEVAVVPDPSVTPDLGPPARSGRARVAFYTARKGPYIRSGDSMKGRRSFHNFMDGEEVRKLTQTPVPFVGIQVYSKRYSNETTNDKKSLPHMGIDPMPLAFKAGVLACFRGKGYRTRVTCFQGKCRVHCTSSATLH